MTCDDFLDFGGFLLVFRELVPLYDHPHDLLAILENDDMLGLLHALPKIRLNQLNYLDLKPVVCRQGFRRETLQLRGDDEALKDVLEPIDVLLL